MTESDTGSRPPEGAIRLTRFIILAGENWSDEAMVIAWLRERGCTVSVARDVEQLGEQVRELGENAAYVILHQPSLNPSPHGGSGVGCICEIVRGYLRIQMTKPGKRLWTISVESPFILDPPSGMSLMHYGDAIDTAFTEPLEMDVVLRSILRLERNRCNPEFFPDDPWDE